MRLVEIYNELKEYVVFFCVYIKEAHPLDGWVLPVNTAESIEAVSYTHLTLPTTPYV